MVPVRAEASGAGGLGTGVFGAGSGAGVLGAGSGAGSGAGVGTGEGGTPGPEGDVGPIAGRATGSGAAGAGVAGADIPASGTLPGKGVGAGPADGDADGATAGTVPGAGGADAAGPGVPPTPPSAEAGAGVAGAGIAGAGVTGASGLAAGTPSDDVATGGRESSPALSGESIPPAPPPPPQPATTSAASNAARTALVLHADNGAPQRSSTLRVTLERLGITSSFSRPRVSDDNPYSEALFRTTKYRPGFPADGFADLAAARSWVHGFVAWYNTEHRHSAIRFVTPAERHEGRDAEVLAARKALYEAKRRANPSRWSGKTRDWTPIGEVWLNPERPSPACEPDTELRNAA